MVLYFVYLPRHRDADDIAPLADAVVALAVDGFVFPERALPGGRQRGGVGVVGHGVHSQEGEAFAIATIHPDFHAIHALLGPADCHVPGIQLGGEDGLHGAHVHDLIRANELQSLAYEIDVAGATLMRATSAVARPKIPGATAARDECAVASERSGVAFGSARNGKPSRYDDDAGKLKRALPVFAAGNRLAPPGILC